ncbi:MAG: CotH kinase family protein, partial [Bacteroidota bacterium]
GDDIQLEYPKDDAYRPEQAAYISNYVSAFENTLRSLQFANEDSLGYRHYIEPSSFIDFLIVNELAKNVDGYRLSTWLFKDREGRGEDRLQMGPLWDFNLAFGNANYCTGGEPEGWVLNFNRFCPQDGWVINNWWDRLLGDPRFQEELEARWFALREDEFSEEKVLARVDAMVAEIGPAAQRNFVQWGVMGEYVWPNSFIGTSYQQEIDFLKNWLRARLRWMDANIEDISFQVSGSFSNGASVGVYPNPFSDELILNLQFNNETPISLVVRDMRGKAVYQQEIEVPKATFIEWRWNALDNQGHALPVGLYFLSLQQNDEIVAGRKLVKY